VVSYLSGELGAQVQPFPVARVLRTASLSASASEHASSTHSTTSTASTSPSKCSKWSDLFDLWAAHLALVTERDREYFAESLRVGRCVCGWGAPFPPGCREGLLSAADFLKDFDAHSSLHINLQLVKQILLPFCRHPYELATLGSLCSTTYIHTHLCRDFTQLVANIPIIPPQKVLFLVILQLQIKLSESSF